MAEKSHNKSILLSQLIKDARYALVPTGYCYACGEPLQQANGVFCDDRCGADYVDEELAEDDHDD